MTKYLFRPCPNCGSEISNSFDCYRDEIQSLLHIRIFCKNCGLNFVTTANLNLMNINELDFFIKDFVEQWNDGIIVERSLGRR